jgi:hypothetical protein
MGHLNEITFASAIAPCQACGSAALEISSYIDRGVAVMLADANDDGKWLHTGEKFIDGAFRVKCTGCGVCAYESQDCPRCHAPNTLAQTLAAESLMPVPKRCPECKGMELTVTGFSPGTVTTGGGGRLPAPTMSVNVGQPGFHAAILMCDSCEWVAVASGCPLCNATGPLRARP